MKYEDLNKDFIAMFPEDSYFFKEKENETGADVTDGIHVVFGMAVVPYVTKIVKESSDKAQKAFAFFEKMETAEDPKIAEVLEFTVLEHLLTDDADLAQIYANFFGEETRKAAIEVGKWYKQKVHDM